MVASYCGLCVLKCLLYLVNTILTVLSVVIICVGGAVLYVLNSANELTPTPEQQKIFDITGLNVGSILVLCVGILVILFVFCGCCGACLGAGWMLIWFSVIMALLLISECVIIGLSWKYTEEKELKLAVNTVYESILDEAEKLSKTAKEANQVTIASLAFVQQQFECCGAEGPNDYTKRGLSPEAFCKSADNNRMYRIGCTEKTVDFFMQNGSLIGAIVTATMVTQFVAIIIAMFLYFTIA